MYQRRTGSCGEEQELEEMMKERRNAQVEEGRENVATTGDVIRNVVRGSRTFEIETKLFLADVDDRRVTTDAIQGASAFRCVHQTRSRTFSFVDEHLRWNQEDNGTEEKIFGDGPIPGTQTVRLVRTHQRN